MKVLTACTFAPPIAPRIAERTAIAIFSINCQSMLPLSWVLSSLFATAYMLMNVYCTKECRRTVTAHGTYKAGR